MSQQQLSIDDLVRCPRCRQWHPAVAQPAVPSTAYANAMLYVRCGTDLFYVGQAGQVCQHEVTGA
jgi:hypothetical protein